MVVCECSQTGAINDEYTDVLVCPRKGTAVFDD